MHFSSLHKVLSSRSRFLWVTCLALLVVVGCDKGKNTYIAPPPPKVTVAHPVQEEIVETRDYTGTTKAFESVEILARVEGFLDAIEFEDGAGC